MYKSKIAPHQLTLLVRNSLAFTKEAGLVRSLLNASVMYLIVKICQDAPRVSCGCRLNDGRASLLNSPSDIRIYDNEIPTIQSSLSNKNSLNINEVNLGDLSKLNEGAPVYISKLTIRNSGKLYSLTIQYFA